MILTRPLVLILGNHLRAFCVFLGDTLISLKTKKQHIISLSSFKAEYRALTAVIYELQLSQYLLSDLHIHPYQMTLLYCDNLFVIKITKNHVFHKHMKHIKIDCHVVRQKIFNRHLIS